MTRAAIYLRISQDPRQDGLAVDRQRSDCERIIRERRGWEHVESYADTLSAYRRTTRRPGYERMLTDFEAGKFDAVVCWDLDRLTRQPSQLEEWIRLAEERGLVIVTANGEADLSTDDGRMFARIKASVSRHEIERKSARQLAKNRQNVERGRPIPGRRRLGYESDGCTPRPDEAALVRRLFEHVAAGGSIRSLTRALIAEGVDPAPGRSWTPRRVRDTLLNEHYVGTVTHRGSISLAAAVVPIVDAELAAEVRAMLADPSRHEGPGPSPTHIASGIAVCGADACGRGLYHSGRAYRCVAEPTHPAIRSDVLDGHLRVEVAKAFLAGGAALFSGTREAIDVAGRVAAHARNLAEVASVLADRAEGLIPAEAARVQLRALRGARERIEADLERARAERGAAGALAQLAGSLVVGESWSMRNWAAKVAEVAARFDALDLDARRELVRALLYVQVDPGRDPSRVRVQHLRATHLNPAELAPER